MVVWLLVMSTCTDAIKRIIRWDGDDGTWMIGIPLPCPGRQLMARD